MAAKAPEAVVLDTSLLVAYFNTRDVHHAAAARIMLQVVAGRWGRALLLEYVVLELATVLMARRSVEVAAEAVEALLSSTEVDFVPCSDRFVRTLQAFADQRSGTLSFADAAILATARERAAGHVATFDADFASEPGITVVAA
jgi:predicted nucleic acid-binding protein